ncbi:MAG: GLUG motif-containing protein [Candidatus Cloacimonadaceae bacterium]|nr:GLUG motif-containing protein [Candidatus Cloacimonadaceae bacterium]
MKQTKRFGFLILLLLLLVPLGADDFSGGSGTINDPWLVANAAQLNLVRNYLNNYNHYFRQVANINLDEAPYNAGQGWVPIGSAQSQSFRGSYDGDGFSITGLMINRPGYSYQGLFGYAYGARISNLNLESVNVSSATRVGALLGIGTENVVVSNCSSSGTVIGTGDNIGGLVGLLSYGSQISGSQSNCAVSGQNAVGGLLGNAEWNASVLSCNSGGTVTGWGDSIGGLVGSCFYVTLLTDCFSYGPVNCPSDISYSSVGGLIGGIYSSVVTDSYSNSTVNAPEYGSVGGFMGSAVSSSSQINGCYATGLVTARAQAGGFIGYVYEGPTIQLCYATGNVTVLGTYDGYCGGFVGTNQSGSGSIESTILKCYSTGNASGYKETGGFVGRNVGGTIQSCYSTGNASGYNRIGGFCGYSLSTAEISDCYSSGGVIATELSGGFIGGNDEQSLVSRCYNYGVISFNGTYYTGGFSGLAYPASVSNCYWNIQTTGVSSSSTGEGRNTDEMTWPYAPNTYQGFGFPATWAEDQNYYFNGGYPYLSWRYLIPPASLSISASGTSIQLSWNQVIGANSYKIYSALQPDTPDNEWVYLGSTANLFYNTSATGRMFFRVLASSAAVP